MKVVAAVFRQRGRFPSLLISILYVLVGASASHAQQPRSGRGALSFQDLTKMASPAAAGSDAADQVCARYSPGSIVSDPPVLQSQNGVLEVNMKFLAVIDSQGLTRYCYVTDTGLQAPTLIVNPGDRLVINFQNDLPAASASASGSSDNAASMKMTLSSNDTTNATTTSNSPACNGAMGTNVTNIHFHGTNIAPLCGQDEVIHTLIQPGQSFQYNVTIPTDEPPGLYWYHPHPHGISEGQVQGGATGAFIVEGLQNVDSSLAGMPERTLVIRDQLLPTSEASDPNIPAWDLSINYIPVAYPGYVPATIQTNPNEQELWRVANTAADTILNLQYTVNRTPQALQVVAIDGYPIAYGSSGRPSESETSIPLGPGARAEFVVTTPNVGDQAQLVTEYWNTGPEGDYDPARPIANIVSRNGVESSFVPGSSVVRRMPSQGTLSKSNGGTRFTDLASLTPAGERNLYFSEVLQDPTNPNSSTTFYITEEGQTPAVFTMDQQPNIVVHSGTVEDWTIQNRAQEDHIFHIHQLHFQVLEVDGQPVNDPALRDTVDIPYWSGSGAYPSVTVRMDFSDPSIIGTFVYHCHILEHEDGGMMGEIQVLPPGSASATTVTASQSSITPNGNITLTANVADAATGSPTPTGLVQFELNGANVGNPVALGNGQVITTTPMNGNTGTNNLTAFYEGDSTYTESTSAAIPITISDFSLASSGANAAAGAAAIANVAVNVANNYTNPISLACTMPSNLTESACFVNPKSITGAGQVQLTVNTTPAHPLSAKRPGSAGWLAAGGSASLACVFLLALPRRRWRGEAMLVLAWMAIVFTVIGCGGTTKSDPGTAKGTYTVVVTGIAGDGVSQYQASVNVPITIQ